MATTAAVQGAGLLTNVWKKLERAIFAAGGREEHLTRLDKAETDQAFANFADEIVRVVQVPTGSFLDQIRAGDYDFVFGFQHDRGELYGQLWHPVTNSTRLDHPGEQLTLEDVCQKYSGRMASMSELFDFGSRHKNAWPDFPVGIGWKYRGQHYCAYVTTDPTGRGVYITSVESQAEISKDFWLLVRSEGELG